MEVRMKGILKLALIALVVYFIAKYVIEPSPVGSAISGVLSPIGAALSGLSV